MKERAPRAPSGFHCTQTRELALGETMPVSAHFIPPPPPPSSLLLLIKKKTKTHTLEPCNGNCSSPPFIEEKSPPDQSDTGCLLRTISSAVQEQGGLSPWGRQEVGAGSLPRRCGFYSLLQSRREGTPACWELTVPVHPLSPVARCCCARERCTLCTLPGIPLPASSEVHRGSRGTALREVAVFWLLPCVNEPRKTALYKPSSLTEAGSAVKGLRTTLQLPQHPRIQRFLKDLSA